MSKILVLPDIHGRKFWKKPCENIEEYDKIVFLGDYLDPYDFEKITVEDAIENFKDIMSFAVDNPKVVMLLGNHDMPYFSNGYYKLSKWHCRHSREHHDEIGGLFDGHHDLFKIAYSQDNILFTHAGCISDWLDFIFDHKYEETLELGELCDDLNGLVNTENGLWNLYTVSYHRGGDEPFGSCIWADVHEMYWNIQNAQNVKFEPIYNVNQVFGHSLQAYSNGNGGYEFGNPIEVKNLKMLDNASAYILNTEDFTITKL